ncbi:DUF4861 domain-containing protein [Cesiribacter sp. SM1]|uniref:DUF4861 domain-containing protein n=1 Tax=Cesiribacter sp. SM1 TaxID=2861196 RepID=UPI001CD5083B|nr:DUF4861 domain-containing protein [Cesiribacter sp. SM1]
MTKTCFYASGLMYLGAMLLSCQPSQEEKQQTLIVTNKSDIALADKAVSVGRSSLNNIPEGEFYPLLVTETGDTLASQTDDLDGDGQWDELFFVTSLPAGAKQQVMLHWVSSQPSYTPRTSVRFGKRSSKDTPVQPKTIDTLNANALPKSIGYQPYQTDGPSWENDKVGFRHYFDGRNAKDLFGKRTSDISPENVGINAEGAVEDNYHVMAPWGRDVLAVGNSVGIGGIALQAGVSLLRLGVTVDDSVNNIERSVFNIVAEGPVRSIMDFKYQNWQAGSQSYNVHERTSIWPGMYAFKNSVQIEGLQGNEKLLVGLVNSRTDQSLKEIIVDDEWVVLMTHDKQTYEKDWWLGLALILPRSAYQGYIEAPKEGPLSTSYLAKLDVSNNQPVDYYAVSAWELSDPQFSDSTYFRNYVQDLTKQLAAPVEVQVE